MQYLDFFLRFNHHLELLPLLDITALSNIIYRESTLSKQGIDRAFHFSKTTESIERFM